MGLFGFGPPNVQRLKRRRDVSGLVKALGFRQSWEVRRQAAEALGEVGDGRAIDALAAALKDDYAQKAAALALGRLRDSRAVDHLVVLLERTTTDTSTKDLRAAAVTALGNTRDPRALPALLVALSDRDYSTYRAAQQALTTLGAAAVSPLIEGLEKESLKWPGGNEVADLLAAEALGGIGEPAIGPLIRALGNLDARWPIPTALAKTGSAQAVAPLMAAFQQRERGAECRSSIAEALARLGDPRCIEVLVDSLHDPEWLVWIRVATALKSFGWEPTDDTQRARIAVASDDWQQAASLGAGAIEPLVSALAHSNDTGRRAAAQTLGVIGDARAVEPLLATLKNDRNVSVREAAVTALGDIPDGRSVEPLLATLRNRSNISTQEAAAVALGRIGDRRAMDALAHAVKDGELPLRKAAAHALGSFADPRRVMPLMTSLAAEGVMADTAIRVLSEVVARDAARARDDDLRAVARLEHVVSIEYRCNEGCSVVYSVEGRVDCSHVRQLARQELIRRGAGA